MSNYYQKPTRLGDEVNGLIVGDKVPSETITNESTNEFFPDAQGRMDLLNIPKIQGGFGSLKELDGVCLP